MLALYNLFFLKVKFPGLTSWSKAKCDCLAQLDMWVLQPCNLCLEGRRGGAGKHFKWKLKQSNTEIKRHNWHSLTVPKFSEAFFQRLNIFLVFPLKKKKVNDQMWPMSDRRSSVHLCRSMKRSAGFQSSPSLSHTHIFTLSLTHTCSLSLHLFAFARSRCLSLGLDPRDEVMITAALWYKSASGRGDAPESNTVSSIELITERERDREGRGRGRGATPIRRWKSCIILWSSTIFWPS